MDATLIKYGVACVAVLAFTGWNRGVSLRAFQFAGVLALICLTTNLLNHTLYYPQALGPYPLIDAAAGVLASVSFWKRPRIWKLALATSFLAMGARHTLFWWGQANGEGYEAVGPYMDNLSDIFKVQLAIVCIPGGLVRARQLYAWGLAHLLPVLRGAVRHRPVRHKGEEV